MVNACRFGLVQGGDVELWRLPCLGLLREYLFPFALIQKQKKNSC